MSWAASALAAAGAAVIGYAGDGAPPVLLGLMLLGISVAASLAVTVRSPDPTTRTFAAGAACGALFATAIAGIPSFGLALLPAAMAWGVALVTAEHPKDAMQVAAAGTAIGVSLGAIALVAAASI